MRDPDFTSYVVTMGDSRGNGEALQVEVTRRGRALARIVVFLGVLALALSGDGEFRHLSAKHLGLRTQTH